MSFVLASRAFGGYLGDSVTTTLMMTTTQTIELRTSEHPNGADSILTMNIDFLYLQNLTLTRALSGSALVEYALDASQTGVIEVLTGSIDVANGTNAFSGAFLQGTITTVNVGGSLTLGPDVVTNRSLSVTNSSAGSLLLDSGTLRLTITGGLLSSVTAILNSSTYAVDLATDPLTFQFSDLGTSVLDATTDDDESGLDPDGAELNMPLQLVSSLNGLFGGSVPSNVTAGGYIYLGSTIVPEFGSFGLLSFLVAAGSAAILWRRCRPPR
jgi:hypothetical protein